MSKTTTKRQQRKKTGPQVRERRRTRDRSIYLGLLIIGAFIIGALWLILPDYGNQIALGYVIALAWLTNLYAVSAYRGKRLANWQQALARIPLRFAGFGTKHGKPLEAAHDAEAAKSIIFVSIAVSLALVVIASFVLLPELRGSVGL